MTLLDDSEGSALPAPESLLRLILDHISDLVAILDSSGTRLYNNPAYRNLFGDQRLTGTDSFGEIHPDDRERIRKVFRDTVASGVGERAHYRFVLPDGSVRHIESQGNAVREENGAVTKVIVVSRDITSRKHAEERLASLNAELENRVAVRTAELASALDVAKAADHLKSEFMANITHELRTPLSSVIGFASLLKDGVTGPLNVKQEQFVGDIVASGNYLLTLVEGILEMSRVQAAGIASDHPPMEVELILKELVAARRTAAAHRGVTLQLDVAPETSSAMLAPMALRRMLDVLIDNAIKFNCEGGKVTVSTRRAGNWIDIAVADTGIGIAPEDMSKLFKPLTQLGGGLARRHSGIGLGLALARRIAEQCGGTIVVASESGKGSTFTLRLPLEVSR